MKVNGKAVKVFVAMSGGVDSSVAAALLKYGGFSAGDSPVRLPPLARLASGGWRRPASGWDVRGVHIKMWSPMESRQDATAQADPFFPVCQQQHQDRMDAMRVAAHLGIPFETWDLTREYREAVVEYMIREYAVGRTPNPDVMCNREIKFGVFLREALARGADYIATGHYVRLERKFPIINDQFSKNTRCSENFEIENSLKIVNCKLKIANDLNKDQSYFLWTLTQEQLQYCLFPIGEYTKPEVRQMARKFDLPTAEKKDSQGICFVGEIDVREFLQRYIPRKSGAVMTTHGRIIGEHEGLAFYTIGQRQGIGISNNIPYYVAEKHQENNTLVVAEGPYDEKLFSKELYAGEVNWISGREPKFPFACRVRIRYRQPLQEAVIESRSKNHESRRNSSIIHNSLFMIRFREPQRAVTPGQSVVFYKGKEMLGGGIVL